MRSVTLRIVSASNSVLWIAAELMKTLPDAAVFLDGPAFPESIPAPDPMHK